MERPYCFGFTLVRSLLGTLVWQDSSTAWAIYQHLEQLSRPVLYSPKSSECTCGEIEAWLLAFILGGRSAHVGFDHFTSSWRCPRFRRSASGKSILHDSTPDSDLPQA